MPAFRAAKVARFERRMRRKCLPWRSGATMCLHCGRWAVFAYHRDRIGFPCPYCLNRAMIPDIRVPLPPEAP